MKGLCVLILLFVNVDARKTRSSYCHKRLSGDGIVEHPHDRINIRAYLPEPFRDGVDLRKTCTYYGIVPKSRQIQIRISNLLINGSSLTIEVKNDDGDDQSWRLIRNLTENQTHPTTTAIHDVKYFRIIVPRHASISFTMQYRTKDKTRPRTRSIYCHNRISGSSGTLNHPEDRVMVRAYLEEPFYEGVDLRKTCTYYGTVAKSDQMMIAISNLFLGDSTLSIETKDGDKVGQLWEVNRTISSNPSSAITVRIMGFKYFRIVVSRYAPVSFTLQYWTIKGVKASEKCPTPLGWSKLVCADATEEGYFCIFKCTSRDEKDLAFCRKTSGKLSWEPELMPCPPPY